MYIDHNIIHNIINAPEKQKNAPCLGLAVDNFIFLFLATKARLTCLTCACSPRRTDPLPALSACFLACLAFRAQIYQLRFATPPGTRRRVTLY
jgi:hypothetical protein